MEDTYITKGNPFPNEVEIDLNVLGALMLNQVGGHVDRADIVAIYQRGTTKRSMEFLKELVQPCSLGHTIGHCTILGLDTGS